MKSCRIVTGGRGEGKTSYLLEHCKGAKGFLSIHRGDAYYLRDAESGEERLLMSSEPLFPDSFGQWYYDQCAFDWANGELLKIKSGDVVLDEVGRLEVLGGGFAPALGAFHERDIDLTIAVRRDFIPLVREAFSIGADAKLVDVKRK